MRNLLLVLVVMAVCAASSAFAADCISIIDSQICVGESHDSVIAKIDKSHVAGQSVSQGKYGPIVERKYSYHGQKFTLQFGRTAEYGPHRLLQIIHADDSESSLNLLILRFEPFASNLADTTGRRFIRLTIDIEAKDTESLEIVKKNLTNARDAVYMLLSSKSYNDIDSIEEKLSIKEEIAQAINNTIGRQAIVQVFIVNMEII